MKRATAQWFSRQTVRSLNIVGVYKYPTSVTARLSDPWRWNYFMPGMSTGPKSSFLSRVTAWLYHLMTSRKR